MKRWMSIAILIVLMALALTGCQDCVSTDTRTFISEMHNCQRVGAHGAVVEIHRIERTPQTYERVTYLVQCVK